MHPMMMDCNFLIIDLEATCCDRGTLPRGQMEVIEIGAVVVAGQGAHVIDQFQTFVRPVRHPRLTAFCNGLTSITQADVDAAPAFPEAIAAFRSWLSRHEGVIFCSWGDYDRRQLDQDCRFHGVPFPIGVPHLNLRQAFTERQGLRKKPGLTDALAHVGLRFEGTHHRGIDDARNIARLLPYAIAGAPPERNKE